MVKDAYLTKLMSGETKIAAVVRRKRSQRKPDGCIRADLTCKCSVDPALALRGKASLLLRVQDARRVPDGRLMKRTYGHRLLHSRIERKSAAHDGGAGKRNESPAISNPPKRRPETMVETAKPAEYPASRIEQEKRPRQSRM